MSENRKNAGVGFWLAVALVTVSVLYPLSMGPVTRLSAAIGMPPVIECALDAFYAPLIWAVEHMAAVVSFLVLHWWGITTAAPDP